MQGKTGLPDLIASRLFLDNVVSLLSRREPVGLASEALSILIRDLGAAGGSLFYAARPPVRVRRGDLSPALVTQVDQWEANVERRITAGSWELAKSEDILSACIPVKGTGQVIIYCAAVRRAGGGRRGLSGLCRRTGPNGRAARAAALFSAGDRRADEWGRGADSDQVPAEPVDAVLSGCTIDGLDL